MSKTVEELIGVYIEASNAVVWEAEKRGLCPMTLDMQRAGIAAVVRALRDEMGDPSTFKSAKPECCGRGVPNYDNTAEECCCQPDTWILHEEMLVRINEILGVAESDKASGSGPASAHTQEQRPGPQVAGSAKTVDAQQCQTNTIPATDPAPAVCVWKKSPLRLYEHSPAILYRTGCGADFFYNYKQCQGCGKPIKFTEAKT